MDNDCSILLLFPFVCICIVSYFSHTYNNENTIIRGHFSKLCKRGYKMSKTHSYDSGMRVLTALEYLQNLPEPAPGETSVPVKASKLADYLSDNCEKTTRETAKNILDAIYESDTGYHLERKKSKGGQDQYYYHRPFTIEQISLLSTIICSSMFLAEPEINQLLNQLKTLTAVENSHYLPTSEHFLRPRMMNKYAMDNLQIIHKAINERKALRFYIGSIDTEKHIYYDKTIRGRAHVVQRITLVHDIENKNTMQKQFLNQGNPIICFPYSLAWDNSRCYLICGLKDGDKVYIWNYRVDRMFEVKIWNRVAYRDPKSCSNYDSTKRKIDTEHYLHSIFKMFPSAKTLESVTILFKTNLTKVIVERFGFDVQIIPDNNNYARVKVKVQISQQFYGWLAGFKADDLCLIEPKSEVDNYLRYLQEIIKNYQTSPLADHLCVIPSKEK